MNQMGKELSNLEAKTSAIEQKSMAEAMVNYGSLILIPEPAENASWRLC